MPPPRDGNPTVRTTARPATNNKPGEPGSRRSPFLIGMAAAAGVAVVAGCIALILIAVDALVRIGLALFIAIGL
jgi:hypothetical protein